MKLSKITYILIFSLFLSCEDFLEEEPYSFLSEENFPETAEDGRIALNGAYSVFRGQNIVGYDDVTHNIADTEFGSFGAALTNRYGLWQAFNRTSADQYPTRLWTDLYKGINSCNVVIDVVNEKQFPGGDKLVAEAKALRAYFYLRAISLYGDVPLLLKSTNGISSLSAERTSVDEIRTQIILDLEEAEQTMEAYSGEFAVQTRGGLLTLGAVKMIKARLYMLMTGWRRSSGGEMIQGDPSYWTNVRDICQEIIDLGVYQLDADYTNVFADYYLDTYNAESIWEADFSMPAYGSTFPNAMSSGPYGSGSGGGFGNMRTTDAFYNSFDTLDVRRDWSMGTGTFSGYDFVPAETLSSRPHINKFRKVPGNGDHGWNTPYNTPIYRYSEVLLMLAEALNEINNGPTTEAYDAINQVRYRARRADHKDDGMALPDLAGLNYNSFKDAIIDERAFELAFEGKRKLDLIRWGLYMERLQAFPDDTYGVPKAANVREDHMLLPIPLEEMNLNDGIWNQNNGW